MNIGNRIKEQREKLNMSQEELARKAGYKSRSSINKIETDGRGLPQNKVVAIAKALNVTPAYLMGWENESDTTIDIGEELSALLARIESGKSISLNGELLDDTSNALVVDSMTNMLKLLNALANKS